MEDAGHPAVEDVEVDRVGVVHGAAADGEPEEIPRSHEVGEQDVFFPESTSPYFYRAEL
jgi:hypothetical protein